MQLTPAMKMILYGCRTTLEDNFLKEIADDKGKWTAIILGLLMLLCCPLYFLHFIDYQVAGAINNDKLITASYVYHSSLMLLFHGAAVAVTEPGLECSGWLILKSRA